MKKAGPPVKKVAPPPISTRLEFVKPPVTAIVLLALATGIIGAIYLKQQADAFRKSSERTLISVAELKTRQISDWYAERLSDAEVIHENPMVMPRLSRFLSAPTGTDPAADIGSWLESTRERYGYRKVVLYDAQGMPRLHVPASRPGSTIPAAKGNPDFLAALHTGEVRTTDLQPMLENPGQFSLKLWIPVPTPPGSNSPALGVVLLDIDPDRSLYPLVQTWPSESRTAETLLIRREGNEVVFLNRLRHRANVPLALRLPLDSTMRLPAALAALGREGVVSGADYRGAPVLASVQGVSGTPWFLVAKEDIAEIDAPLRKRDRVTGVVLLLVFAAAALGMNELWLRREAALLQQQVSTERESAERFRTLVESLPQLVWTTLPDGRCDYLSPQWVEYTGLPEQDQLGHGWAEQLHPDDRARAQHDWQEAVATGSDLTVEFRIRRADGIYRWFHTWAVPLRDAAGRVVKWFGTNTDVDDRKQAEEALSEAQAILRTAMDCSQAGIAIADAPSGILRYVNRAGLLIRNASEAEALTGIDIDQYVARWNLLDLDGTTLATDEVPLVRALTRGEECSREFIIRRADSDDRTVSANAAPILSPTGEIKAAIIVFLDITERRLMEEALKRTAEELSQANEEVRQFAYIVSHDLQAPLVNVRGFTSELSRSLAELSLLVQPALQHLGETERAGADLILRRDVPDAAGFINASVARMDHLINALLRLSRLGRHELIMEWLDLGPLVSGILASLGTQIEALGATVTVLPLPEITADRTSLEQILGNILTNAVLYLDPARPGRIEISGKLAGTDLLMKISDNGRGIAPGDREKVFAPFRRAGAPGVPGEGMGLAYVQALVRRQGGRIWFDSEPGVGTTFSFVLPVGRS